MLFDLRGRGRRNTVRVIYIGLAVLIGVGLVGFGIGGGFGGGGLLSAATNAEGGSGTSYAKQIAKYRKLTKQQPANASAWENLTRNLMREASGEGFVTSSGLTSKGHQIFEEVAQAWSRYLALQPSKPDLELTKDMERIFGEEGLNQPAQEVQLLQVVVGAEPGSAATYGTLAEYAYKAHDTSLGDLAAAKAVALAPAANKKSVKNQLAEVKKAVEKESKEGKSSTGATSTSSGSVGIGGG
jgi:O6-methylguanine-DNA--protein-cysteine methyltransferase